MKIKLINFFENNMTNGKKTYLQSLISVVKNATPKTEDRNHIDSFNDKKCSPKVKWNMIWNSSLFVYFASNHLHL